jgi:hypothetical protein
VGRISFDKGFILHGLLIAEEHGIPLEQLRLALNREPWLSQLALQRLAQVHTVPQERECQLSMLRKITRSG